MRTKPYRLGDEGFKMVAGGLHSPFQARALGELSPFLLFTARSPKRDRMPAHTSAKAIDLLVRLEYQ